MTLIAGPCKQSIADLLFVWQGQLNDAKLNYLDAISAAEMMVALVLSNTLPTRADVHEFIDENMVLDLHEFIDENWEFLEKFRQPQRGRPQ